jgi:hypothetical protein
VLKYVIDMLQAERSGDRIPEGGEISPTRPDQPWGPHSLLYNWYRVSFPGVKQPGCGADHPPPSSAEVKKRLQLYLYSHPRALMAGYGVNFTF